MSMMMQISLLRTLRYGEIQKVGDERLPPKVNVRIVAACNDDLGELVAKGLFRADVYSRLRVAHIHVPPLRERREDLPLLAEYCLNRIALQLNAPPKKLNDEAMRVLNEESWQDNIAGLENCLLHAFLMTDGDIGEEHLPVGMHELAEDSGGATIEDVSASGVNKPSNGDSRHPALRDAVASFEADYIQRVLADCDDNVSRAARVLRISRQGLQKKIQRLQLVRPAERIKASDNRVKGTTLS
jgi:DNA-binding NtrC family response regulator